VLIHPIPTEELYRMAAKKKAKANKKTTAKAAKKPTTKSESLTYIADKTGLTKKEARLSSVI